MLAYLLNCFSHFLSEKCQQGAKWKKLFFSPPLHAFQGFFGTVRFNQKPGHFSSHCTQCSCREHLAARRGLLDAPCREIGNGGYEGRQLQDPEDDRKKKRVGGFYFLNLLLPQFLNKCRGSQQKRVQRQLRNPRAAQGAQSRASRPGEPTPGLEAL